ncbi:glycoside hydrolase domain-containing protein [Nocardiopsis gilva]|nr:glycoside hydrolase domain-containing protein [Nocardiopsis gilva]
MYALTRCLQHELGITGLSNNFGPGTLGALQVKYPKLNASTVPSANFCRIIQSGLYCKGYDGGEIDGKYNDRVSAAVRKLKADMGVAATYPGDDITPKLFKGLLNMDPYVVVNDGSSQIQEIQRWLNGRYADRRDFFIIPCDGHHSRSVQKALMLAIQYELDMEDGVANGVFGPGTRAGLKEHTVAVGTKGTWALLFNAALVLNKRDVSLGRSFTAAHSEAVEEFQLFAHLPATGRGDYQTWASLLVSTGDPTRKGTACDCVTEITNARAKTLVSKGYKYVGRYLSNVPGSDLDKVIKPGELKRIATNGLRSFPIYQTYGGAASYFNYSQGASDAYSALEWARHHGFKAGARIYFAVDFDAVDHQVTSNIIPHFRGIQSVMSENGPEYDIGIYGPRNVCSRVAGEGLSTASFVSDMSTGFSGNLGYTLPIDWAFDQISTIKVGSGEGKIEIDNNIASGRDIGEKSFDPKPAASGLDVKFDMSRRNALLSDVRKYLESQGIPEKGGSLLEGVVQPNSTGDAFSVIMKYDSLITNVARKLKIRKALLICPLLWEIRKFTNMDDLADDGVVTYHTKGDWDPTDEWIKRDSSTGLGQIFAARPAIPARNLAVRRGYIVASILDPDNDSHVWRIWQKLYKDDSFNIATAAHVLIWGAHDVGIPRPNLDYSEENTRLTLKRYRGFKEEAEIDSQIQIGLYQVFEKHFTPLRST